MPKTKTATDVMPPIGKFVVMFEDSNNEGRIVEPSGGYAYHDTLAEARNERDRLNAAHGAFATFSVAEVTSSNEYTYR